MTSSGQLLPGVGTPAGHSIRQTKREASEMIETIEDTLLRYASREDRRSLHKDDAVTLARLLARGETESAPALDPRRRDCVTASDVAAICGENSYETPVSVLRKKMLRLSTPDNEYTLHGKEYEPVAIAKVAAGSVDGSRVKAVHYLKFLQGEEVPWIGGTLDGVLELEDGRAFVLEVKCPLKRRIVDGCVPGHYMSQIQTYMFLTGLNACAFVQFAPLGLRGVRKPSPEVLSITLVARDPRYIPLRLPLLKRFHDRLVGWRHVGEQALSCAAAVAQHVWRCRRAGIPDPAGRALRVACAAITLRLCHARRRAYEGDPRSLPPTAPGGDPDMDAVRAELAECGAPPPAPRPYVDPGFGEQEEDVVCAVLTDPADGPAGARRGGWRASANAPLPHEALSRLPATPAQSCAVLQETAEEETERKALTKAARGRASAFWQRQMLQRRQQQEETVVCFIPI